jgi:hypothetical protein
VKSVNAKGENKDWFMSATYETDHDANLANTSTGTAEKLFVPANVEIKFTLTVNDNGTLTLVADYTVVDTGNHTYTIAGDQPNMLGTEWDAANTANDMTYDEATGLWTISFTNTTSAEVWLNYKVCRDHGWSKCWGAAAAGQSGDNAWVGVGAGKTVTITFNAETEKITTSVN